MSVFSQSVTSDLAEAFKGESQELLDIYINEQDINDTALPDNQIERKIRGVLSALFKEYSIGKTPVRYADAFPQGEEYITVQPEVKVCFTDKVDIDSALIRHRQRRTLEGVISNPHKDIFSFFMSGNYSDINRQTGCTNYPTKVEKLVGDYKLIVADTSFVKAVVGFLNEDSSNQEIHFRKVNFLDNKLKLFEQGGQVRKMPVRYTFHYSLFVDKIIFDHEFERAYVQYSFKNKSSEAHFLLDNGQWVLKTNVDVLEY